MGGDEPELAPPSPEETRLLESQTALLDQAGGIFSQQNELLNLVEPELLQQIGFDVTRDGEGGIASLRLSDDALADDRAAIERGLTERSLAALAGELPVDPVLLQDLEDQQQGLEERLRDRLGTGFDVSSAGIEALLRQEREQNIVRGDARRKDLITSEGLRTNAQNQNQALIDSLIGRTLGVAGARSAPGAGVAGVASGFSAPISGFRSDRHAQFQSDVQNADSGFFGGLGEFIGTAAFAPTSPSASGGSLFSKGVGLFT